MRYEDDVTNPQQISAMGFTLESLAAQTCDEFWSPKFTETQNWDNLTHSNSLHDQNGSYLECPAERYSDLSPSELATVLSVSTTTFTSHNLRQYILSPVSATATV